VASFALAPANEMANLICATSLTYHHANIATAISIAVVNSHSQFVFVVFPLLLLELMEGLPYRVTVSPVGEGLRRTSVASRSAGQNGSHHIADLVFLHE
jgi:hypothetical protein